jgi:hypothetical protein
MKIKRKELLEALKKCMPGIEAGNAILEGADTFVFSEGWIHSYNDSISISVPIDMEDVLEGAVRGKEFFNILSKLPENELKFHAGEKGWTIRSGAAKIQMSLMENLLNARIQGLHLGKAKWKDLPDNFSEAMNCCKIACNRSPLSGIMVSENHMTSTDNIRLNWFEFDVEMDPFWISDKAAGELMKFPDIKRYAASDSWIHFQADNGACFSCKRLMEGKYPIITSKKIMESHKQLDEDLSNELPKGLFPAIERAATLSMDIGEHDAIRLTIYPDHLFCYSERSSGKYEEKLKWEEKFSDDFDPVEFHVDPSMIQYALKRSPKFFLKQITKDEKTITRLIFFNDHFKHLLTTIDHLR